MRVSLTPVLTLSMLLLFSAFSASCCCGICGGDREESTAAAPACETCGRGLPDEIFWCDSCNAGFIKGKKTSCKGCVEAAKSGGTCPVCSD